jgi:DNA-binding GntR family transcriptional regulator
LKGDHPQHRLGQAVERAMLRTPQWSVAEPSQADHIAIRLAGLITLGQIAPGSRLLEQDISAALDLSRAPGREALRILEREHLVVLVPRRGAVVTSPDARELSGIFEVRSALYRVLLAQLMRDQPDRLAQVLAEHLNTMAVAAGESPQSYAVESFLLNLEIAGLSGNRVLADLLRSIALRTLRYVHLGRSTNPASVRASLRTWRRMLKAVRAGKTIEVLEIAAAHIDEIRTTSLLALG